MTGCDRVKVKFEPIFFQADLIGNAKIMNFKQCNGYYGCSVCNQHGFHIDGTHHFPYDFDVHKKMLSPECYPEKLRNLEEGSQQKLKTLNSKKSDFEKFTQGVKGRSKIFLLSLISRYVIPIFASWYNASTFSRRIE